MPNFVLATLCLNEMEWLPTLYAQHRRWPGLAKWVFVESADRVYAETNPGMVSSQGLSTDGTSEFLQELSRQDDRIVYVPFGFSRHSNPAQGKCESRSKYLSEADKVKPEFLYVVDADEFYTESAQEIIVKTMEESRTNSTAFCFKQRHIWRPPSIAGHPLFEYEARGGFWNIPHCRGWRWFPGLRYVRNHNTPEMRNGYFLDRGIVRYDVAYDRSPGNLPYCVHMGFASSQATRVAKNRYYAARGEGTKSDPKRGWYVESREAFDYWTPAAGMKLPHDAIVAEYNGDIPEAFIMDDSIKPVCNPQFWKSRLNYVKRHGQDFHKSIYIIDSTIWEQIQQHCAKLLTELPAGTKLLDAGCGYGALTEVCPKHVNYTGVDISPDLVYTARTRYPNHNFKIADMRSMSQFRHHQFDVALCRSVRGMVLSNLGGAAWNQMRLELNRIAKRTILIEYGDIPTIELTPEEREHCIVY